MVLKSMVFVRVCHDNIRLTFHITHNACLPVCRVC